MRGVEFFSRVATKPPFSQMHPTIGSFFKEYLSHEKIIPFQDRFVVNTHFPPFPGNAFDNLARHLNQVGDSIDRHLYSVTLAVTNRCGYNCWHCYNAGRSNRDLSFDTLHDVIAKLQEMNAVKVTITGGEPLLRHDLADIAGCFNDSSSLVLNTTGYGLTPERASELKESGIFAVGISLDSDISEEHDRMRGKEGAFDTALNALRIAGEQGLYPYVIAVASHDFLKHDRFMKFMNFAKTAGALEVHLLEPCPTGKLAGRDDIALSIEDKNRITEYQDILSSDDSLPILSSFSYLESPDTFGCGAGLTHLYIDGSGEVGPCNLVPISFGNIMNESLDDILDKMACYFQKPRCTCVGHDLSPYIHESKLPLSPEQSAELCEKHLPSEHDQPKFFRMRSEILEDVGKDDLESAYNKVHGDYDEFWVREAGRPVVELVESLPFRGNEHVIEAGCGTGYATALLAGRLREKGQISAVDLSAGMLEEARKRVQYRGLENVDLSCGDALEYLKSGITGDIIFSSWVLGYIPLQPFFEAASGALNVDGRLAFIVHRENSPAMELSIFGELIADDPSALSKRVLFDFPGDTARLESDLTSSGFEIENMHEGNVVFSYSSAREVLEHLLKSGAGTAFYDAVHPEKRSDLEKRFLAIREERNETAGHYEVIHDYYSVVARKK